LTCSLRPADPDGSGGLRCVAEHFGPEPVVRGGRWRVDAVGPPGPAHECPELVKPILRTDIGVNMSSHRRRDRRAPRPRPIRRRGKAGVIGAESLCAPA
jgi:hypothetical protein